MRHSLCLISSAMLLGGCQSLVQREDQVFVRSPGTVFLANPTPTNARAAKDLPFAWLSEVAYGNTDLGRVENLASGNSDQCPLPQHALQANGWEFWPGFPDDSLVKSFERTSLRIEVWMRKSPQPVVVVTFGGTDFKNWDHWRANLRWLLPRKVDEYSEVQNLFAPAFLKEYKARLDQPGWEFLRSARLFATGHSLGGGLAQQFAYALPADSAVPRVEKVVVFNTSPVTGYSDVDKSLSSANARDLNIDRIYERGEILAPLRFISNIFWPVTPKEPAISQIRYSLFFPSSPIEGHKIRPLACRLNETARAVRRIADSPTIAVAED